MKIEAVKETVDSVGVSALTVNIKNSVSGVQFKIEKAAASEITSPLNESKLKVFSYFSIAHDNVSDKDIGSAAIRFEINKTWLKSINASKDSIILKRYHDNTWRDIRTEIINETEEKVSYNSMSPGLSLFAIISIPGSVVTSSSLMSKLVNFTGKLWGMVKGLLRYWPWIAGVVALIIANFLAFYFLEKKKIDRKIHNIIQ